MTNVPLPCPKHKREKLHKLFYYEAKGKTYTNWLYCAICKKPILIKFELSTLEGEKI